VAEHVTGRDLRREGLVADVGVVEVRQQRGVELDHAPAREPEHGGEHRLGQRAEVEQRGRIDGPPKDPKAPPRACELS
jgi:hypothetical protein